MNNNVYPSSWDIRPMKEVIKWSSGGTPKSKEPSYYGGDIPWLIISDLNDSIVSESEKSITQLGLDNSSAKLVPENTLLLAMYGSIGKLGVTGIECATNQAIAFAKEIYDADVWFLYYYFKYLKPHLFKLGKGGTQRNISLTVLNSLSIPLPPLPEQNLIVQKIEELFSELDKGIAELEKVKQQLKIYRQAVLKAAFEGEFTPEACFVHGTIGEYVEKPAYGTSKKCTYEKSNGSVPVYRIPNIDIKKNLVDEDDLKYRVFDDKEFNKLRLKDGDVLLIRSNGSVSLVGRCALVKTKDENHAFAGYLIRLRRKNNKLHMGYLVHYLNSFFARRFIEKKAKSSNGINNINSKEIQQIPFLYCKPEHQQQLVSEIESRLTVCDNTEKTVDVAIKQAESLKLSILKKAFEGQLLD